ncbi:adenosylcobyric acid synthase [Thalassobacillus cyri]|uniref:Cobyric acid synthase n=1 Tax=Thalassobacillus cyri TaxID=571932 RepID=A0A1H3VNM4_9BACI|nr:cobyric acid synthase [Thalassobacillus cyri]SDZ76370.1 adenosylcobyric acid synthase [Thalassobacillus cyri]
MGDKKAIPVMVQGTHSDAGKSILVTALCRILTKDGYLTAPFKSQNMALNSYITVDGKEIGRAQGVQAEAAGIAATTDMNPVLIKPNRDNDAQIVVHGKPVSNMKASDYRTDYYETAKEVIANAYNRLAGSYDRIVIEGAGSPAEVNLNDRELVNMSVAKLADAPVILVGDINKGGVFASLVGTLQLLSEADRDRVMGVVINKFRGDKTLLDPGLEWFEEYTGKPVLGVIPFIQDLHIDAEDSLSLSEYTRNQNTDKHIDIAVIEYPKISNFTDIDPFLIEHDCHIRFVKEAAELKQPDAIILPGSKNTIEDLVYLKDRGLDQAIMAAQQQGAFVFGICGGYQMIGNKVSDPYQVETSLDEVQGLELLPIETTLARHKKTVRSSGTIEWNGRTIPVTGYEIHMGETVAKESVENFIEMDGQADGTRKGNVMGTYFHGTFHNDTFRTAFLNLIRLEKGLPPLKITTSFRAHQEEEFDRLAFHVREALDIPKLYDQITTFKTVGGVG